MVVELQSGRDLEALITRLGPNGCIFIDFFAHWCPPCRAIAPVYEQLAAQFPSITFTKVNVDQTRDISTAYGIRAMPTFIVLQGGREVERIQGADRNRLQQLAQQYAAAAAVANPNAANTAERLFLQQFTIQSERFAKYYDSELAQMLARSVVPPRISDAIEEKGPTLPSAVELMKWFKSSFFRWIHAPDCPQCKEGTKGGKEKRPVKQGTPTPEEAAAGASRVEVHTCPHCQAEARFPRYNDPIKLIETRGGRCGEWANCFALIAHSLGFKTRFIYDVTDHVWVELFLEGRWIHFDPCEATFDKPLLYEVGWKKPLSYVMAFGRDHVADVTWKYVGDPTVARGRRRMVREAVLSSYLSKLSTRLLNSVTPSEEQRKKRAEEIRVERVRELIECIRVGPIDEKDYGGRISGDAKWRLERGEMEGAGAAATEQLSCYTIKVSKEGANEIGEFVVEYDVVRDEYSIGGETRRSFLSSLSSASGLQRKEEADWKMAYICRQEGSQEGAAEWEADLSGAEIDSVTVEARDFLQKEGSRVILTVCSGDQCMMVFPGRKLEIAGADLSPGATLHVKAQFMGGSNEHSFQHAQLFRASLEDPKGPHLSMRFKLK
ncbi:hypothetical protein PENTCL1PPCAC_13019 [Pristionchus entomophagus]|uniref:Peptide-N(4)-(N-acetyl-beta-glucosaminyl)asparagine amidase n=1 Tax=Pristionchus entomophagus TaxID=358040 RepID=A0AAV5T6A1_9BILA|nr:hypothetical protein PENTCL1PPCAC_13019 [Pristionchus entomophagus]